ncbi:hypothetical protein K431DRAFT_265765 [Polychaeton citri CBS 116435]|uniref:Zn(2)-C6 fungal-type domain-containing protein n=1 Tax=Polychaeton citri CBS 116435 TaxID=1314669 RepID=A0A9P4UNU6_9PEZI|nr:hypothetical protein K431DRAFT_265765 [Polychaeton citri CBS 116435]
MESGRRKTHKSTNGVRKPRPSRGKGLRANTGCITCRRRHVKCDEVQPTCGPCSKGNRDCVFTADLSPQPPRDESNGTDFQAVTDPSLLVPDSGATPTSEPMPRRVRHADGNFESFDPDVAARDWFGLFAKDASAGTSDTSAGLEALSEAALTHHGLGVVTSVPDADGARNSLPTPTSIRDSVTAPYPAGSHQEAEGESSLWQSSTPIALHQNDKELFHLYVTKIGSWIDLFDPLRHFTTMIPKMALTNQGLMASLLALSARFRAIKMSEGIDTSSSAPAVQYYHEALRYLQIAMRYASYKDSSELLATTLLLAMYEMLDGSCKGWDRHIKGLYWIMHRRNIEGGFERSLERAIWWTWLRHNTWIAFRERRKVYSLVERTKPYNQLNPWELAGSATHLLAQAIDFCSDEERQQGENDLNERMNSAKTLLSILDDWRQSLTVHFDPLPNLIASDSPFRPIWIPAPFGASMQTYCVARLLTLVYQPLAGGPVESASREKEMMECIDTIAGIALTVEDDASRVAATQCLFMSGFYCNDKSKLNEIVELIMQNQVQTGWPSNRNLAAELLPE